MSDKSSIEWTDATWNPIRGCSRVSEGCRNCYAERVAARFSGFTHYDEDGKPDPESALPYAGIARMTPEGPRWTGNVVLAEDKLDEPLRWRQPRRVFVNSMSDLFHEKVPDEWIDRIFAVMALAHWHTYQILTKRPERMLDYYQTNPYDRILRHAERLRYDAAGARSERQHGIHGISDPNIIPWRQVWLGVSVEDQPTADERIQLILQTPAALRFVSYEPGLGPVDFRWRGSQVPACDSCSLGTMDASNHHVGGSCRCRCHGSRLDWVICGGESGPGARPFAIDWARSTIRQCRDAGVACFVKQLGACAHDAENGIAGARLRVGEEAAGLISRRLRDPKGGDPWEWPADLRVREFPKETPCAA